MNGGCEPMTKRWQILRVTENIFISSLNFGYNVAFNEKIYSL